MNKEKKLTERDLVIMVIGTELALFMVALIWMKFSGINPFFKIYFGFKDMAWAVLNALILLAVNFLAINELSKFISFFKRLKGAYDEIACIAADVSIFGASIIALISGFIEEVFFRGILQAQFGIIVASLVFGLFHVGSRKTLYYGLYTTIIGFYLGWLYSHSGNLLVPIAVHTINNFLALPYMKYYYRKNLEKKDERAD